MNLASKIRSDLQAEIEEGKFAPGTPFDERSLAERFKVSRTPVREALQQLAALDLVRIEPRIGVFVSRLSIQKLRALFELLSELEMVCAKLAARRMDVSKHPELLEALDACEKAAAANDSKAYSKANQKFHETVYANAHNEYLVEHVRLIRRKTQRYRVNDLQTPKQIQNSLQGHREITEALIAGDAEAAHFAMSRHMPIGGEGFSEFLSTLPADFFEYDARAMQ